MANNVVRATLTTTPVAVCGVGNLTHVGAYRVKARVYASSTAVKARLSWKEGAGPLRANTYASCFQSATFIELDLGLVNIPQAQQGTQRWTGQIEAYTTAAGDTIDIDHVVLVPAGEGYGRARTAAAFETPTAFTTRDEFDQSAGNLTGKTAAGGGTWTAFGGDTDDWVMDTTGHTAQRTASSDSNVPNLGSTGITGRLITAGTGTLAALGAQVDFKQSDKAQGCVSGLVVRAAATTDYAMFFAQAVGITSGGLYFFKVVSSTASIGRLTSDTSPIASSTWYTLRVLIDAAGRWLLWYFPQGAAPGAPVAAGVDSALATGGALASGKYGIFDGAGGASTRNYDNFLVFPPTGRASVFAGRQAEFRYDEHRQQDSTGTYYGPFPAPPRGSRFLIPPAGDKSRPTRILAKADRSDIEAFDDTPLGDSLQVQALYTPRYLAVPR